LDGSGRKGLCIPVLDDLQTGAGTRRTSPQGREVRACRLCQRHRAHGRERRRRGDRAPHSLSEGLQRFNADQIEGLPANYYARATAPEASEAKSRIPHVDAFFHNLGADIREGGNQAYYRLDADFIAMPAFEAFVSAEAHAATLGHETIHWTRHEKRLNRDLGRKAWGDEGYAREELVAELGSVFLAADLGLAIEPRDDHAAYISSWLKVLKNDKRAVFQAASHAERAVTFLHSLQPGAVIRHDEETEQVPVAA
jgi:antirestriction protein ArdC